MKKLKKFVPLAIIIVLLGIATGLVYKFRAPIFDLINPAEEPTAEIDQLEIIDIIYLKKKLEKIAELRTAKVSYGCIARFEEGSIWLIDKKSVAVYYEAEAYAGINVGDIVCNQDENGKFIIQLPAAVVYDSEINIKSKKYVDQEKAILNWTKLEDSDDIDRQIKNNFKNQKMYYNLLDMADENAVSVIRGLLIGCLEEEQFEIKTGERKNVKLVSPPFSSEEKIENSKDEIAEEFEKAGFRNIQYNPIEKKSFDVFAKDGKVEKITIDGNGFFEKSDLYRDDVEVIITYQKKA